MVNNHGGALTAFPCGLKNNVFKPFLIAICNAYLLSIDILTRLSHLDWEG